MQRDSGKSTPTRPNARHGFTGRIGSQRREKRFSQASTRRPLVTYDQHGRPWFVETEIRSGMPCSPFQPLFLAPWYPHSNYIKVNPNNTAECFIDYPTMRQEKRVGINKYHSDAVGLATEKKWAIPQRGQPYAREIIAKNGNPPLPLEPIIAAEQENPWIIGWSDKPDPRLVELVKKRVRVLTVEEEGFDFTEQSYAETVATVAPRRERTVQRNPDQQQLMDDVSEFQAESVAGAGDDDEFVPHKHGANAKPIIPEEEAGGIFDDPSPIKREARTSEALLDIEEGVDPGATGGQRVPVKTAPQRERAERRPPQAPTGKHAGAKGQTKGGKAQPAQTGNRRTIAQGAKPVVAELNDE